MGSFFGNFYSVGPSPRSRKRGTASPSRARRTSALTTLPCPVGPSWVNDLVTPFFDNKIGSPSFTCVKKSNVSTHDPVFRLPSSDFPRRRVSVSLPTQDRDRSPVHSGVRSVGRTSKSRVLRVASTSQGISCLQPKVLFLTSVNGPVMEIFLSLPKNKNFLSWNSGGLSHRYNTQRWLCQHHESCREDRFLTLILLSRMMADGDVSNRSREEKDKEIH